MSMTMFYRDALPWDLIERVQKYAAEQGLCMVSRYSWDVGVVSSGPPVLVKMLSPELKQEILDALTHRGVITPDERLRADVAHYSWLPGSSIPWHTDSNYSRAATVYLNQRWDKDWGGYLAYLEEGSVRCVVPEFNAVITMRVPLQHAVLLVHPNASIRETLQLFVR